MSSPTRATPAGWPAQPRHAASLASARASGERILILGGGPLAGKLLEELDGRRRCVVVGLLDDAAIPGTPGTRYRILGSIEDLPHVLQEVRPDRIVVALTARRGRLPLHDLLQARARGILVEDGVEAYERLAGKVAIEALTPGSVIFSRDFRKAPLGLAARRVLSVVAAVAGLLLLAPLLLLVALAIVLDSPGPVFFRQDRVGASGHPFTLFKFRTMRSSESHSSEWERDNGHRITRVGWWLRRFRLDELPQFWNVLRGDMNLVGPRPHPTCNHSLFVERIPYYGLREAVLPGITGWAQVRYGYANGLVEETEKVRYDLFYVKHLSLWLDLRILVETVCTVVGGSTQPRSRGGRVPLSRGETGPWPRLAVPASGSAARPAR